MTEQEAIKIENGILGTYMSSKDLFDSCQNLISEKLFSASGQTIFRVISYLHKAGANADLMLLSTKLQAIGYDKRIVAQMIGDLMFNTEISRSCATYVKELYNYRKTEELYSICSNIAMIKNIDLEKAMFEFKSFISETEYQINNVTQEVNTEQAYDKFLAKLQSEEGNEIIITTGNRDLDAATGGFRPPYVYTFGARPGMGKTTKVIQIIRSNLKKKNVLIVFFSLEMPSDDVILSLVSAEYDIDNQMLLKDRKSLTPQQWEKIQAYRQLIRNSNLVIDDTPGVTHNYIRAKLSRYRKQYPNMEIIAIIDYLQLMGIKAEEAKGKNEEAQLTVICNAMPMIGKDTRSAIVILSQLSRDVERRDPPVPIPSDLKGSGSIEANSAYIFFLYRPEYYKIFTDKHSGRDLKGIAKIIIAKNRYGPLKNVYTQFYGQFCRFSEYIEEKTSPNSSSDIITNNDDKVSF